MHAELAATGRDLRLLLVGLATSVLATVVWSTSLALAMGLAPVLVGLVVFVASTSVWRAVADLDRANASAWLRQPVRGAYRVRPAGSIWVRMGAAAGDPQTWRDFVWLFLHGVLGIVLGGLAVGAVASVVGALLAPLWWWALPDIEWDVPAALLIPLALPLAAVAWALLRAMAWTQAHLAAALLGPHAGLRSRRTLTERVDELTRTRSGALDVQAAELRRIERDLHDGAQARLVALSMQLGRAEERLAGQPEVAELVRRSRLEAGAAIAELRDLARGIAPPVLADRGLGPAVEALARRSPIPVTLDVRLDRRLPAVVETAAYFVVAEALTNVAKHAPAAKARVCLAHEAARLRIDVADDGRGGADPEGGGLTGLRHRVEALDGTLAVLSRPGGGTTIQVEIPCGS